MKRKDILIIISIVFVICLVGVITFTTKSLNQEYPKGDIEKGEVINPSKFSIYIEDENGNWVKYNIGNGAWPGEEYEYDHAACVDKDGNPTDYQPKIERKEDGKVYVESNSSVKCDLYFRRATSEPGPGTTDPEPEPPVEQELPTCSLDIIVATGSKIVKITPKNADQFGIISWPRSDESGFQIPKDSVKYDGNETIKYQDEVSFYGLVKNAAGENYCRMDVVPTPPEHDPGTCNPIYGDGDKSDISCSYQKVKVKSCGNGMSFTNAYRFNCLDPIDSKIYYDKCPTGEKIFPVAQTVYTGEIFEQCQCGPDTTKPISGYTCSYSGKKYKIDDYENAQQECSKDCSGEPVCEDGYSKENYAGEYLCVRRLNFH